MKTDLERGDALGAVLAVIVIAAVAAVSCAVRVGWV